jgi:hypothetical protein
MLEFYTSHIITPNDNLNCIRNGKPCPFIIHVISSLVNERKTISFVCDGKTKMYNINNENELQEKIKKLLQPFTFNQVKILKFDKAYPSDFTIFAITAFTQNLQDFEEKIREFNLNKDLQ